MRNGIRELTMEELDTVTGAAGCKVNDAKPITHIDIPGGKGVLVLGTETCNGVNVPYALWLPG